MAVGLALAGCDDGSHDGGELGASGDNLKGRKKDAGAVDAAKETKADAAPSTPQPVDAALPDAGLTDMPDASQEPAATCAVTLCKVGTTCVEGPNGAECIEQACTAKCSAGQHCELQEVVCIRAPCLPVPTCVDDVTDPCALVRCKAGTHCVSTQPQCFTTPCPRSAECVAD